MWLVDLGREVETRDCKLWNVGLGHLGTIPGTLNGWFCVFCLIAASTSDIMVFSKILACRSIVANVASVGPFFGAKVRYMLQIQSLYLCTLGLYVLRLFSVWLGPWHISA